MEKIELPVRAFKSTDELDKIIVECALQDIPFVIRSIASNEILQQTRQNNPPTNIIVDGSGRKAITSAQRRVQAFFVDKAMVRRAVYEAWNRILNLTRVRSGRAASSYELWFNNAKIGSTPSSIEAYLEKMDPAKDGFRIVGPVLVYGRKVYWNPKGKPKFRKLTAYRSKTLTVKLRRIKGIMDQVEQQMRRRYRGLAIAEQWVITSALPKDGRTPGLYIGFKKRGNTFRRT